MKKLISILFEDEINRFHGYTKQGKRAYVYFAVSFVLFCVGVCAGALTTLLTGLNLLAATLTALHFIPDFEEDC